MQSLSIDGLTPVQVQVATALAAGISVSKAAAQTDVGRTTIYTWINTVPRFSQIARELRAWSTELLRDKLYDYTVEALATVAAIMNDPHTPASVRLRAALAILNRPTESGNGWESTS